MTIKSKDQSRTPNRAPTKAADGNDHIKRDSGGDRRRRSVEHAVHKFLGRGHRTARKQG